MLKGGKINALLDQMEHDALKNCVEADKAVRAGWRDPNTNSWQQEKLDEDLQIQRDAYTLSRSIRKYAPFIETGAMTIAEAISCEIQRTAGKPPENKK